MLLPFLLTAALADDRAGATGGIAGAILLTEDANPIGQAVGGVARLGVSIVPPFDLEFEAGRLAGETRDRALSYWFVDPALVSLYHLTPRQRLDVFVALGTGIQYTTVRADSSGPLLVEDRALTANPSTDVLLTAGPGLIVQLAGILHLRTDLRWHGTFGPDSTRTESDTYQGFAWSVGVDLRGEEDPDRDGDGILNKLDVCPDQPEDVDDFEDDDGCPEDDNDADGITDKRDRCPDEPEDRDGFEDTDGCPDPDNDKDGVSDRRDACPEEPEDDDGWEDDDGCPERDNDKDGIADKRDSCPDEPETRNNYDDRDGCPDEVPAEVRRFTGVIRGITFETNKAVIRASSTDTLLDALDVLRQHPSVRMEVQGHTDDVGNDQFNLELSQARAEAVVQWFLDHEIAADRLRAVGYGETTPIADNASDAGRAENRRVEFKLIEGPADEASEP